MARLPPVPSLADWPPLRRGYDGWPAVMREICARHALAASELQPAGSGTNVVFVTGQHAVKLYPPFWQDAAAVERATLAHVAGRLGVATPEIVAVGSLQLWPYLVTTRLPGVALSDVWATLARSARRDIAGQVGRTLRELHAVPTTELGAIAALAERWPQVIEQRVDECVSRHRAAGIGAPWLDEIAAFLDRAPPLCPPDFVPVLLDADVHPWHLLGMQTRSGWRLTGLFDFDDAMLGWREYDLAGPAVFMLAGQPDLLDVLLSGYGYDEGARDGGLRRRLMAYALLNRYWGLDVLLEYGDPARRCATLAELERALFPLATD